MMQELRKIYEEFSNRGLSQNEALERIKAVKLREQNGKIGPLLAVPVWQESEKEASDGVSKDFYSDHHVMVCELGKVKVEELRRELPHSHCWPLEVGGHKTMAERYSQCGLESLERIQAILQGRPQGKVLVQVVVGKEGEQALLAGLVGLLKTAGLENPQLAGQLLVVAGEISSEELGKCLQAEKRRGGDALIRYEGGVRQVLRWQEVEVKGERPAVVWKEHGVYLITGGLGGLGVVFAQEILRRTEQARVVLTGRGALEGERQRRWEGLGGEGGRVSYRRVDLEDGEQLKQLMGWAEQEYGRLNGIVHSAGIIADNFILKKSRAEFREVLKPKVTGTYNLDQASGDMELDFFVLFSSLAGAMGNVGQADYAVANAFMDQFARYRNGLVELGQRKGRTRSINWGLWRAGGMGMDAATEAMLQQSTGIAPMETATGLEAFYRSLALPYDQILVMQGELVQMRRTLREGRPLQPDLSSSQVAVEPAVAGAVAATEINRDSLEEKTREYLRRQCAEVLKLPWQKIDPQAELEQYGMDSILAMKLTNQLEKTFGSLSKTLFFEYQTLGELTRYFMESQGPRLTTLFATTVHENKPGDERWGATLAVSSPPVGRRRFCSVGSVGAWTSTPRGAEAIAIIGLSGRYPEAINLEVYWRNLRAGKDCIIEVPPGRWDWRKYFSEDRTKSGHHYSKWGGFIAGVDEFDPLFFNISPKEAKHMDPQERLFLQHVWMAIEDAGYTRAGLQMAYEQDLPGQVGVYVGVMYSEYQLLGAEASVRGQRLGIAASAASIANRVSYVLNLHGPSMTLDTMCSSSLSAIHVACQDLKQGRTSLAIAGGVNVSIHPNKYLVLSAGQFISSAGQCQSFGEGGDGYIPGEGVGVVVLKRLGEARRDGDHIYGIIRGSALNHGGKTNGYSVPNPQAQSSAISRALAESKTDARHISYIEAHGTGTKLGDPIEITALTKAFQRYTADAGFCRIGSVKSNIGHCESAAGIAGLTKVLLQMQHQQIVPSLHSTQLNPHIDFPQTPFVVNQELRAWEAPVIDGRTLPRIAGVSSFGAGGSNAHLIVEEHERVAGVVGSGARTEGEKVGVVLSARTAGQLQEKARELLEFVRARGATLDVGAMAYTLQVGREAMQERLGFVVSSAEQVVEKLQAYLRGEAEIEDFYQGQVRRDGEGLRLFNRDADLQATIDKWMVNGKLSKLLELWVQGLEVEWGKLYGEEKPPRMSLPTYPFARERYWVESRASGEVGGGTGSAMLHPLVQCNSSDLSEQRYSTTFTGEEFFLSDHRVEGKGARREKMLPAVAYLEMARAAIEEASPRGESGVLELHNVVWAQLVVVGGSRQVNIGLWESEDEEIEYEIYSGEAEQEEVYCQGRAVWMKQTPAPAKLDVEQLKTQMGHGRQEADWVYAACAGMGLMYGPAMQAITGIERGHKQVLARLRLPGVVEDTWGQYVLHPSLLDGALQACVGLMEGQAETRRLRPYTLERLRVLGRCTREMVAWVRYAGGSDGGEAVVKLDIDVCDESGNVMLEMRGIGWQQARNDTLEPRVDMAASSAAPASLREITLAAPAPVEIAFGGDRQATSAQVAQKKPTAIPLTTPSVFLTAIQPSLAKPLIKLSDATLELSQQERDLAQISSFKLYNRGHGIFSIKIPASISSNASVKGMIAQLLQMLDRAQREQSLKVLMISGLERCLPAGSREAYNEAVEQKLYEAIVSFPCPVIAMLPEDVLGPGFMAAALCDFMVCNEDARYGYTDTQKHFYPTTAELRLLSERFGAVQTQDLLYVSTVATGSQLRNQGWTCPILAGQKIEAYAEQLAAMLARKPQEALRLLKQHLTRCLVGPVQELRRIDCAPETENPSGTITEKISSEPAHLRLETRLGNVVVVRMAAPNASENKPGLKELVAELERIFAQLQESGSCKAIVLAGEYPGLDEEIEPAVAEEVVQELQRVLIQSQIPVVAVLDGDVKGTAWLISQFCDACVYSQTGIYSAAAAMGQSPRVAQTAVALFTHRLGNSAGREVLLTGADYSGADLHQRVGGLLVAGPDEVLPRALRLAESWAKMPRASLAGWKQFTAAAVQEKMRKLPIAAAWREEEEGRGKQAVVERMVIPLQSKVITATAHGEGIVVVKMEEQRTKNMFSEALREGISEVFAHIQDSPAYKVVILTGYDNYFACGGSKEDLLAIQTGQARFTDSKIYQVALDCKLPVIAAMQGHGIGAGWTLGMFADIVLLSQESTYMSPYMNYGFTPGAGATYVLAEKMGNDLARENLLTGQPHAGRELQDRGVRLRALPRAEVNARAMELARQIGQSSRGRLMSLKQQLNAYVQPALEETYRLELAMHDKTFVGSSDTLALIQKYFYQEIDKAAPAAQATAVEAANPAGKGEHMSAVTAKLKTLLADELQMGENDIDEDVEFIDLGLDSVSGVTWVRNINENYHTSIEATKLYSYSTLSRLSGYVREEAEKQTRLTSKKAPAVDDLAGSAAKCRIGQPKIVRKQPATNLVSRRRPRGLLLSSRGAVSPWQPIAVIGMAGQFPQARNLEQYWQNIAQGKDCITQVPSQRWDVQAYYEAGEVVVGKSNSQWVGALEDYGCFDPLFFNISPTEAESMDPQQRLFLQACWHSIEHAGYDARSLSGSKCGVYVGCASADYHHLSRQHELSAHGFTGGAMSILAARISYFLNLQGPCLSIDTACSSSLVAIAQACDSLSSGGSDLALAGGVYVMTGPELHIKTSQAGMLSPAGKCYTFDQRADGFVPGEGVGVVLLKRLAEAQRDGDIIYGVIEGWGVNQDGRSNGITAPNPESQTRLEQEVYDKYQIDPGEIQLIEAHGTATKLGDPIEVEGLKQAFKKYTQKKEYCALGSVKSNIGHCLTAAGIAGVIKLLLALQHKQLPPTINFEQLNQHIELKDSPFYVNTRLREWPLEVGQRRQSAISSFGFSGTNAHLVIGESVPQVRGKVAERAERQPGRAMIPLSARTVEQLEQKARELLEFVVGQGARLDLREVAYTLQVGREAMEERVGMVVSSVEELRDKLQAYVEGKQGIDEVYRGPVRRGKENLSILSQDDDVKEAILEKWINKQKYTNLLQLWVKGVEVDWSKLYGEEKPRRMSLPLYPFARERYWITADAATETLNGQHPSAPPQPVLHDALGKVCVEMRGLASRTPERQVTATEADGQVISNLPAAPAVETDGAIGLEELQQQIKITLARLLKIEISLIDVNQPFVEFGLDSFLGAKMTAAINEKYGTQLVSLKLFDYPTVRQFSSFLEQEIKKTPARSVQVPVAQAVNLPVPMARSAPTFNERTTVSQTTRSNQAHSDTKIAIIGMSGRYPQAANLKDYWDNLAEGRNSIVEVPRSRWDVNQFYDPDRAKKDKTNSKWLGAIEDIDCFDPLFFRISPHEAEFIDPQHRLFLQESYRAFEDAGYSSSMLSNVKCGVYLGISINEYMLLLSRYGSISPPVTSNSNAIAAARIAYYLNLKGPAISVDTACSSSLVAIHLACQGLLAGETEMALAGGVSLWLTPESYIAQSQAGMFSPVGQCKTFDNTADGIVVGDGVGVVVLKRLKDAEEDNDMIYGVILGSGVNQDGKTNGITAPSINSQIELERAIYAKYNIDPETISYIEAHGTGTKLGDPIELEALATVFKEKTDRKNYCGIGSVKSNIGHTTSAAGVAGVQKVLLSMQHRILPPSLNVTQETSHFDFKNSPFYVVRLEQPWNVNGGCLRRAAVSSFGFSGTNAHLVIEEYPVEADQDMPLGESDPMIVPLSARTADQLLQRARDLLEFIGSAQHPVDLAAMAYTLQNGRQAMEERVGFIVNSVEQLREKLNAFIDDEKNTEGVVRGHLEPGNDGMTTIALDDDMQRAIGNWIERKKLSKLLDFWVRGLNFDWNKLYGNVKPRRISLPTYPFAKERCWLDEMPLSHGLDSQARIDRNMESIKSLIDSIGDDTMGTEQAIKALRLLV